MTEEERTQEEEQTGTSEEAGDVPGSPGLDPQIVEDEVDTKGYSVPPDEGDDSEASGGD